MRYAKIFAWTCVVAAFAATALASVPVPQKITAVSRPAAFDIPLHGYVFRVDQIARAARPAPSVPLSATECTKSGGEVNILFACKSGRVCSRDDESGRTRGTCLTKSSAL
jgi:hypothetical protein